ncbi:hypothetical protein M3Y99_00183800 [Aphelenchoides fujianensis]|nr:hypothetical protein M3Y99_00183800 [Aphelenchoides fujianensis]
MASNKQPSATAIIGQPEELDLAALVNAAARINGTANGHASHQSSDQTRLIAFLQSLGPDLTAATLAEKIRLLMAARAKTNNAAELAAQQARKARVPLPWKQRLCFSGDFIVYSEGKALGRDYLGAADSCTFAGCNKRLASNVNFIQHVQGARPKPRSVLLQNPNHPAFSLHFGLPEQLIDKPMQYLHTESCLDEKEVPVEEVEKHAELHGDQPLPFACPACKWRTSSRHALLFHFEQLHDASNLLFCPFCLLRFPLKRASVMRGANNTIQAPQFVDHVLQHFQSESKKISCNSCSLKFCGERSDELRARLNEHHQAAHQKTARLKVDRRPLSELFAAHPNQRTANATAPSHCFDCGYLGPCKNAKCFFKTRCVKAQQQHEFVCPFGENAASRIPWGWTSLDGVEVNSLKEAAARPRVQLTTDSYAFINDHLRKCLGTKAKPLPQLQLSRSAQGGQQQGRSGRFPRRALARGLLFSSDQEEKSPTLPLPPARRTRSRRRASS